MSLINEALKRARIEAARHDAAEKGVPASALPVYVPRRRRPWLAPLMGFLLGLTVVGVAAGAWWMARQPSAEPTRFEPPAVAVAEPAPHPPAQPAPREPSVPPPSVEAPQAAPPPPVVVVEAPPPAAAVAPVAEPPRSAPSPAPESAPAPVAEAPSAAVAADPSPASPSQPQVGKDPVYTVEASPSGGARVKLDFIVWSESSPFAQINGELVNPGQQINGYTLVTVERNRVELEGAGERFWLRVR